jgi:carboxypeptidase Q
MRIGTRLLAIVLGLILTVCAGAQALQEQSENQLAPGLVSELRQLQSAALEGDYAYKQLAHLCNSIGPRLSGSPQAAHAVEYVASELRRLGLQVELERVSVPHWVRGIETAELVEFSGQAPSTVQKIVLTALGGSVATPSGGLSAEVLVAKDFDELNALGKDKVKGKIVLFNQRFDKQMAAEGFGLGAYGQAVIYRSGGPSAAAKLGAVASLVRSVGNADYRLPHTGALRYTSDSPKIPAAAVAAEDADLIAYLLDQGPVRMRLILTPETLPDAPSHNVIADIKGAEHPEEVVIVSGHLDSWDLGTGAIDDGAGVAAAMQTVQLITQLHLRPKRTIRLIAWMNEENGGAGARTYATEHAGELGRHVAAIESDLGAGHPVGFEAYIDPKGLEMLAPISAVLRRSGAGLMTLSFTPVQADITPLERAGVPGFGLTQDGRTYFSYHHTAADTFDKIMPRELAENAAAMAVLAYGLASMPRSLPRLSGK